MMCVWIVVRQKSYKVWKCFNTLVNAMMMLCASRTYDVIGDLTHASATSDYPL